MTLMGRVNDEQFNAKQSIGVSYGLSASAMRGHAMAFPIPAGFQVIGSEEVDGDLMLFTVETAVINIVNGKPIHNGVIHLVKKAMVTNPLTMETTPQYTTQVLFDDSKDPWGNRLGFVPYQLIVSKYISESTAAKRIYFRNSFGQMMVINKPDLYNPDGSTIHSTTDQDANYKRAMSCHQFQLVPDLYWPNITFVSRLENNVPVGDLLYTPKTCALSSGTYFYVMRYYTKSGYASTWSIASSQVFVTSKPMDSLAFSNHHHRIMTGSGQGTGEGVRIRLNGIDTRWYGVEVAYVYFQTRDIPALFNIFYRSKMDDINLIPDGDGYIVIDHTQNNGMPVDILELSERRETLRYVEDFEVHKNKMFFAGPKMSKMPQFRLDQTQILPSARNFFPDTTTEPTFVEAARPGFATAIKDNDPLSNSPVVENDYILMQKYEDKDGNAVYERLPVIRDRMNYKSQQWHGRMAGYFGGETYPVGAVWFDKKGAKMLVQPLGTYVVPQKHDPSGFYNFTKPLSLSPNKEFVAMGFKVNGLMVKKSDLYDEYGELAVSGLSIVRGNRGDSLIYQGLLMPTMQTAGCDGYSKETSFPLHMNKTDFQVGYTTLNSGSHEINYSSTKKIRCNDGVGANGVETMTWPYYYTIHSPDVLIEGNMLDWKEGDEVHLVSMVGRAYANDSIEISGAGFYFYSKLYSASNKAGNELNGRPSMGARSRVRFTKLMVDPAASTEVPDGKTNKLTLFDAEQPKQSFSPEVGVVWSTGTVRYSVLQPRSVLAKLSDFESADVVNDGQQFGMNIVNYRRPAPDPDPYQPDRPYYSTHHYQRIDQKLIDALPKVTIDNEEYVNFKEVQVMGGDCYIGLFDPAWLYPGWDFRCRGQDQAFGVITPIESKYNLALRAGRSLSANAFFPEAASCNNERKHLFGGIMPRQTEGWNYNLSLLARLTQQAFQVVPKDLQLVDERPYSISYSSLKTNGEVLDSFRRILPLNIYDYEGRFGIITDLIVKGEVMYMFQEKAFSNVPVNERTAIVTDKGQLVTGTGRDIDAAQPIRTTLGCQHPRTVKSFNENLYFTDADQGVFGRFSTAGVDELSAREFQERSTQHLTALKGITRDMRIIIGADRENRTVILTMHSSNDNQSYNDGVSLPYLESIDTFMGEREDAPIYYANWDRFLYSASPLSQEKVYLRNQGKVGDIYDVRRKFELEFVVNPLPDHDSVFTNMMINVNEKAMQIFEKVELVDSRGFASDIVYRDEDGIVDDRFRYWKGMISFPLLPKQMPAGDMNRFRGKYLRARLVFNTAFSEEDIDVHIPQVSTSYTPVFPRPRQ